MPRSARYETLDHWRGLACLAVAALHSTYYLEEEIGEPGAGALLGLAAAGWVGVPMFFVISGYCIAASADAHQRKGRRPLEYFRRRLRRIFPPYWAALALTVPAVFVIEAWIAPGLLCDDTHGLRHPGDIRPAEWFGTVTLTEEWRRHIWPPATRGWALAQAWTLAYEEQFYFVVGALLVLVPRRIFPAVAILTAAEVAARAILERAGTIRSVEGFFFDGKWEMFAAGVLVYYITYYAGGLSKVACYLILLAGVLTSIDGDDLVREQSVAWGFAVLIALLHPFDAGLARSRMLRPLAWVGVMCYSIYLLHWPLVKGVSHALFRAGLTGGSETLLVTLPLCLALSIAVGWAFHVSVERRFMSPVKLAARPEAPAARSPIAPGAAGAIGGGSPDEPQTASPSGAVVPLSATTPS